MPGPRNPFLIFANRVNETTTVTDIPSLAAQAISQAPRKIWLAEPGDVIVTPRGIPSGFRSYACRLLGFTPSDVDVLTVPTGPAEQACSAGPADFAGAYAGLPQAIRAAGLTEGVQRLVSDRPGIELLPYALDRPTAEFAKALGIPLHLYGMGGVADDTLDVVHRLNSKAGFREAARSLNIPIPHGAACRDRRQLRAAVKELLSVHREVVVKPDRAANGYGVLFLSRDDSVPVAESLARYLKETVHPPGGWVVEERLAGAVDVSAQVRVEQPSGVNVRYLGAMRTEDASFRGYESPLPTPAQAAREALVRAGELLGAHLAARGYAGPLSVDALLTGDGTVYAVEANVRRTGTTSLDTLVGRLAREDHDAGSDIAAPLPVWLSDCRPSRSLHDFDAGRRALDEAGLAYHRGRREGAVLVNDTASVNGTFPYLIIGASHARVRALERALCGALDFPPRSSRREDPITGSDG